MSMSVAKCIDFVNLIENQNIILIDFKMYTVFTKPWIGLCNENIPFENLAFKENLKTCNCIIVTNNVQKNDTIAKFKINNIKVPVAVIKLPFDTEKFSMGKYVSFNYGNCIRFGIQAYKLSDFLKNELNLLIEFPVIVNLPESDVYSEILQNCISRCTPIIINKTNLSLELLGKDYPLYYNTNDFKMATDLSRNLSKISQGHAYLLVNTPPVINSETFISDLTKIVNIVKSEMQTLCPVCVKPINIKNSVKNDCRHVYHASCIQKNCVVCTVLDEIDYDDIQKKFD